MGAVGVLSFLYIDCPLARLMTKLALFHRVLASAPVGFPAMIITAVIAILFALGRLCFGKPLSRGATAGMLAGLALLWSVALTEYGLKPLFGRTLPATYLKSGQYGFHWFHAGEQFGSFPSGHTDQAAAILSVLWVFYPRWRWLYVSALLLLSFALMAGEWHFLSDIIAGGFVGAVAGIVTIAIWDATSNNDRTWSDRRYGKPRVYPTNNVAA